MCDECDATWIDPRRIDPSEVLYAEAPDFQLPGLSCSIAAPKSRWATRAEIERSGLGDLLVGEGTALDGG
jgi:hypothetical protein